jgi:hypothetical protein
MDEATAANILRWYQGLEEKVEEFLKYIPPQNENMTTWSPQLATLIVEACAIIDSLLFYVTPSKVIIRGKEKDRDNLNILDYAELYSAKFALPRRKVIFLASPPSYRNPFDIWANQVSGSFSSPHWWIVYNDLKHDRIANFKKASMRTAIDALTGALLIISKAMFEVPELLRVALRYGFLDLGGLNPEIFLSILQGGQEGRMLESSLFALWLGHWELPEDIKDFSPARHHGSKRLLAFFGKF